MLTHSVSLLTLCPLGEPKKAIGPEPQIEPWLTHVQCILSGLPSVSEITDVEPPGFPSFAILPERSSPSRLRFAAQNQRGLDGSGPFSRIHS